MRPDGFGGMAVLITADTVMSRSTEDWLGEMLDVAEHGHLAVAPGLGDHVLLRLPEQNVRAEIAVILESDPSSMPVSADAITNDDIRAACLQTIERMDLTEAAGAAVSNTALAAMRIAEARLTAPH